MIQKRPPVLVIDNYDSFVYNLVHYLEAMGCEVLVKRNDRFTMDEVAPFHKILLSPGPGIPNEAGLLKPLIETYAKNKSILGVCLGQQAIAEVFGGKLINLSTVYHGVATNVTRTEVLEPLFDGIPSTFEVGRYHSWVVDPELPKGLLPTAYDDQGQLMALRHEQHDLRGVQFHPESVLTPEGKKILENWINL